jgi:hypothetical protein
MYSKSLLIAGITGALAVSFAAPSRAAGVPAVLVEQGRLLKKNGNPVTGAVTIAFAIYDAPVGGSVLWSEAQSITPDNGYFSAQLGDVTPIPSTVFNGALRYIGITVGTDPEMTPRQTVDSVPYALLATNVNGDITPRSVLVNGATVIDSTGKWVGPSSGLVGPQGPAGPQGPGGPSGPAGAQGPAGVPGPVGSQGPTGATGAAGPQGATGAAGAMGPAGSQGVAGPAGASGVVAVATLSSGTNTALSFTGGAGRFFLGATASVTIAGGQNILGVVSSTVNPTTDIPFRSVQLCYTSDGVTLNLFGEFIFQGAPGNTMDTVTVSAAATGLAAGSYTVGFCESPGFSGVYADTYTSGWFAVTN